MTHTPGQIIPFMHPAMALSALAAGLIPLAIHLWNRRRHRRVRWAAMRFLLAANRRSARRMWIERVLLLLLRMAIVVLFGLALARPYLTPSALYAGGGSGVHRVLVLDDSLSMSARTPDGTTRFARAKRAAFSLLDSFGPRDGVSFVTLSRPARAVIEDPVHDRRLVRDEVDAASATQRADDVAGALNLVRGMLRSSDYPPGNRVVYLISDVPQSVWINEVEPLSEAMRTLRAVVESAGGGREPLTIVSVGDDAASNLAITGLSVDAPIVGLELPVVTEVVVANLGRDPVAGVTVRLYRDGEPVREETVPRIEPGRTATVRATLAFTSEGTHALEARLIDVHDALPADDVRFLSVDVPAAIPVLVVDGRPGVTPMAGEAWFLATALAPGRAANLGEARLVPTGSAPQPRVSPLEPRTISERELPDEPLDEYRVIVLCNVSRLSPDQWRRLARFVSQGGGLLITAGDLVDGTDYNEWTSVDEKGFLPVRFGSAPMDAPDESGLHLASEGLTHPITSIFDGHATGGLFTARVHRFLPVESIDDRAEAVLRYENGAPALVVGGFGAGRVAVWTTSVNLAWTNLPAKGDFIPLMYNTIAFLTPREGLRRNITVGETFTEPLPASQSGLPVRVTGPGGVELSAEWHVTGDSYAVRTGPLEQAGHYRVSLGARSVDVSANLDPRESDLRTVDEETFARLFDRPLTWLDPSEDQTGEHGPVRAAELAFPLLYVVGLLLLAEVFLAWWFGSAQRGGQGLHEEASP